MTNNHLITLLIHSDYDCNRLKLLEDFAKLSERVQDFIIWNYVNSPNKYKFI